MHIAYHFVSRRNEQSIPSFWLKCILTDGNESSRQQSLSPDDVLQGSTRLIKIFCCSDRESAYQRCTMEYGVPADKARAEISRVNRNRIAHYEYYTGERWGDPHRYDLMLNTGSIGLETACGLAAELYHKAASTNQR